MRAAALALQMGPAADQARGHVLELCQFDLQLAFVRTRALGEDVEDQAGAIDDAALGVAFRDCVPAPGLSAWLTRIRSASSASFCAFNSSALPVPMKNFGFGRSMRARKRADHGRACRTREFGEFGQCAGIVCTRPLRLHQQRTFTFA